MINCNMYLCAHRYDVGVFQGIVHVTHMGADFESFAVKYSQTFARFAFFILTEAPPTLTASPILIWARPQLLEGYNDWLELYSKTE